MSEASDAAEAGSEPARAPRELALQLPPARIRRVWLLGPLHAFPFVGLWAALSAGMLLARSLGGPASVPLFVGGAELLALLVCIALPPWVLRRRLPRPASLSWDQDELVERDGEQIRTAIALGDARLREERGALQVSDEAGRVITIAPPRDTPRWLSRRKASADPSALRAHLESLPQAPLPRGPAFGPDARDARRPILAPILSVVLAVSGIAAAFTVYLGGWPLLTPLVLALTLALMQLSAALPSFHELLALAAQARAFERAELLHFEAGEDASDAIAKRDDGSYVRVAIPMAQVADAGFMRRGGALRVVMPASGWISAPSRIKVGAAPVLAQAAELPQAARERADTRIGAAVELAARAFAVLFWAYLSLPRY